jgi:uncharacterized membrane protein HdeD (DUF308 family)
MATRAVRPYPGPLLAGIEEIRSHWGWLLALGLALIVLGMVAIASNVLATLVSVVFLGWLLFLGGAVQVAHAFWAPRWSGFLLHLLTGALYGIVGLLLVAHPDAGAVSLTLLLAAFFLTEGLFRLMAAVAIPFPSRGWLAASGVVTLVLGAVILAQWPEASLWIIGLLVGIDLISTGAWFLTFALGARRLPAPA